MSEQPFPRGWAKGPGVSHDVVEHSRTEGGEHTSVGPSLYLDDGDVRLYHGDCLEQLRQLPDGCVDMVATSPPFYGLRDYGVDGQIGLEETPDQWVQNLVLVFRECRRVLADHGTLWVEIGDSYNAGVKGVPNRSVIHDIDNGGWGTDHSHRLDVAGVKPKDLLGQPWMLAFALRADGWYLRSEIIWARPNPMPESVTDRPTKSHSTVFLLSKQPRYFYDADAVREDAKPWAAGMEMRRTARNGAIDNNATAAQIGKVYDELKGANARSVWTIPTQPTPFAHFATWPQKLVARMIQAGTSEHGKCGECGKPWVRDVAVDRGGPSTLTGRIEQGGRQSDYHATGGNFQPLGKAGGSDTRGMPSVSVRTLGWSPSCAHDHQPVPCTVLDPFAGSGTTLLVARHHGRHAIGIELNQAYCKIAANQLQQLSLLT